jgi:hypothetical protein
MADSLYSLVMYERGVLGTLSGLIDRFGQEDQSLHSDLTISMTRFSTIHAKNLSNLSELEKYFEDIGLGLKTEQLI